MNMTVDEAKNIFDKEKKTKVGNCQFLMSHPPIIIRMLEQNPTGLKEYVDGWIDGCKTYLNTKEPNFFKLCDMLCVDLSPSSSLTREFVGTITQKLGNKFKNIINKAAAKAMTVRQFISNIYAERGNMTFKDMQTILIVIFTAIIVKNMFRGGGGGASSNDLRLIENILTQKFGISPETIDNIEKKVEENKNVDVIKLIKGGRSTRKRLFRHKTRYTINRL